MDDEPRTPEASGAAPAGGPPHMRQQGNLTTGPIYRTLLFFALPTLGSNVLQSLNATVNTIWIGNFLGETALAATSNTHIIMFLLFAGVFGFGMAGTIIVGQGFGRGDVEAARRAVGTVMGMLIVFALVVGVAGWVFAPDILRLLATPGEAEALALTYLRVVILSFPATIMMVALMMTLRGSGDSMTPLWFMGLTVLLDAGLNPVFILGLGPFPAMGIAGSALATVVGNIVGCAGMIAYIYWRDLPIRLRGAEFAYVIPSRSLMRVILGKGLPMAAQMLVVSGSSIAMIGLINREGVDTAAAFGVVQQLWNYVQMPAMAIGAAVSAMAAQNIGAGRWDRVSRITRAGFAFNLLLTGAVVAIIIFADRALLILFDLGAESPATPIAERIILLGTWGFILFGVTMVVLATVRANGAVIGPLLVFAVSLIPVRIGFAVLLYPSLGPDAYWWSFPAGSLMAAALSLAYYRYGPWREGALLDEIEPDYARERTLASGEHAGRLNPSG